jgi:hypothetical protein
MIILPAILDGLRTLSDKTLKITFNSQELNPQDLLGLMENLHQFGYLAFKNEPFKADEKEMMQELKSDFEFKEKSSAQRLRSILYIMYKNNNEGFDSSIKHYEHHLSKVIEHFKTKLP